MNCREFELCLERGAEDAALESHAAVCPACRQLLELANLPVPAPERLGGDFASRVVERTSGGACRQAEPLLPELASGVLAGRAERALVAEHVAHCASCTGLLEELERLAFDLRKLAVVRPRESLVDGVLRRTLPLPVRLRRWWRTTWPQWVRRPRFATELAYAATLLVVVVFGTPVSPLQAMPERAFDLARSESAERFDKLQRVAEEDLSTNLQGVVAAGSERAGNLAVRTGHGIGTIVEEVASWFVIADEEPPAETNPTTEETS